MFSFSYRLLHGFIVFLVPACLISCAGVKSQSNSNVDNHVQTITSNRVERVSNNDKELVGVVQRYCDLALNEKYVEIKDLIKIRPAPQPPLTKQEREQGMTSPNFSMLGELDREMLEKAVPEMIFTGKLYIVDIETLLQNENAAKISATVRSKVAPERSRTLIFMLHKVNNEWKIYDVTFKELDETKTGLGTEGESV